MNEYYVYAYFDPTVTDNFKPFYIGKGKGRRYLDTGSRKYNMHLYNKIQKLKKMGYKINQITKIMYTNLDETTALNKEIDLIKQWGRIDLNNGVLLNRTDGGDGVVNRCSYAKLLKYKDDVVDMYFNKNKTLFEISKYYGFKSLTPTRYLLNNILKLNLRRAGVPHRILDKSGIISDYKNNYSIFQLSIKYKCDRSSIIYLLKKNNIKIVDGRYSSKLRGGKNLSMLDKYRDDIIKLYNEKNSVYKISKKYGVDFSTVKNLLLKNNIKIIDRRVKNI
jgi:hypothetical protein